jgi:hypothetical protein
MCNQVPPIAVRALPYDTSALGARAVGSVLSHRGRR